MAEFSFDKTAKKLADTALDQFEYKGKTMREWVDMLCTIGFPDLEHATNGDIIRVLFEGDILSRTKYAVGYKIHGLDYMQWFDKEWWNAPYRIESGDK